MSKLKLPVTDNDHIQGSKSALIELVEYGDYECSYCGKAYKVVKQLQEKLGDQLQLIFRNFPLANIHPNALHAATAAEVAADFGKYWEMHDILFENQRCLDDDSLLSYATKLGIDLASFENTFADTKYADKIEADIESGLHSGVNGTPSFYINGEKYEGDPYSVDAFLEYLR